MSVRIKDIADALQLSPATVSMVFNNKKGVGSETRERVLEYANKVGYQINQTHRSVSNAQRSIRFIVYKKNGKIVANTPFFSELIESIESETRRNQFGLVISYFNADDSEADAMRLINDSPLDGTIILATEMEPDDINKFRYVKTPIVLLDSYFELEKFDTIAINNVQSTFEAIKYLIDCGHRRIGHLKSSVRINNFDEREAGFKRALSVAGIDYNEDYTICLSPSIDGSYTDMKSELKNQPELPTAFFADNDNIAFGAIRAMKEHGVNVPQDVSVIGFDDMPYSTLIEPKLTTVNVYKKRMGILAVRRMMERIRGETEEFVKIEVGADLIIRDSVMKISGHS
jgi:DNA-binding LacI/PurR family transcriptional regulator